CERARTRHRAPDHLPAGARALSHCTAAHLWLLDAWRPAAIAGGQLGVPAGDQLLSPGGRRLVQASGDADPHLPRHQPDAILRGRVRLAARSDPACSVRRRPCLPGRVRDQQHRPHQSAGCKPCRSRARLARALVPGRGLFRAGRRVRVCRQAQEGTGCMTKGKSIAIAALVLAALVGSYFLWRGETATPIVGVVRTTEIRIAPEVGGQLAAIKVEPGARVRAGDVLAELAAVEPTPAVAQARAQLAAAKASRDHVYAGVRAEEVASLAAEIAKAKSRLDYTQAQLTRTSTLAATDNAAQQQLDQAEDDVAN